MSTLVLDDKRKSNKSESNFEPKVIAFLCNWCSYAGADRAGDDQIPYPSNVNIIRVMCSGRVDPQFVLKAYEMGADGVIILACHPGDCHYKEGNYRAVERHQMLLKMLKQFGIEQQRCRFNYVSAGEGEKFVQIITETVNTLKALGPISERNK
jgi:F420-non-reducing hydrogenase iron-sulfur subunit